MVEVRLDIGCGRSKFAGTLGVDVAPVPGVDVAADLSRGLPFRDNSVDAIYTSHTLEHMPDLIAAMEELWRVCKDGARLNIWVPHASCPFVTWIDPTHRRGVTNENLSYFNPASHPPLHHSRARLPIQ